MRARPAGIPTPAPTLAPRVLADGFGEGVLVEDWVGITLDWLLEIDVVVVNDDDDDDDDDDDNDNDEAAAVGVAVTIDAVLRYRSLLVFEQQP